MFITQMRWGFAIAFGLALGSLCATVGARSGGRRHATTQLEVSLMNPGYLLSVKSTGDAEPMESQQVLILSRPGNANQNVLHHLDELVGSVNIRSAADALKYVRLGTSPATWYLWHGGQVVEIVDKTGASGLPNYGQRTRQIYAANSGFMGVISNSAFRQGGFSSAVVEPIRDGFVVKRWLLRIDGDKKIAELVQEAVGRTGSYKRVVLRSMPAPQLPATNWYIIKFE